MNDKEKNELPFLKSELKLIRTIAFIAFAMLLLVILYEPPFSLLAVVSYLIAIILVLSIGWLSHSLINRISYSVRKEEQ